MCMNEINNIEFLRHLICLYLIFIYHFWEKILGKIQMCICGLIYKLQIFIYKLFRIFLYDKTIEIFRGVLKGIPRGAFL